MDHSGRDVAQDGDDPVFGQLLRRVMYDVEQRSLLHILHHYHLRRRAHALRGVQDLVQSKPTCVCGVTWLQLNLCQYQYLYMYMYMQLYLGMRL